MVDGNGPWFEADTMLCSAVLPAPDVAHLIEFGEHLHDFCTVLFVLLAYMDVLRPRWCDLFIVDIVFYFLYSTRMGMTFVKISLI